MPPPIAESDQESAAGTPLPPKSIKDEANDLADDVKGNDNVENGNDDDDEYDDEDEEEEVYVVEKLQDHRSNYEDGKTRYLVKWKGYEAKRDRTWEPEENLEGANDALAEYWASIGGKPVVGEKPQKKRGRQSGSTKPKPETKAKKQRTTKEVGDDDWKPPPVKDGSWDPLVQSVDTVVRENSDGELWGYLIWNEQSAAGRYYRSKAKLPAIYKACPQRMLHFYEKHLVFTNSDTMGSELPTN